MLAAAARFAVGHAGSAVIAARSAPAFQAALPEPHGPVHAISADYADPAAFLEALAPYAPYDTALHWIRPAAETLRDGVAVLVRPGGHLIEVMGSAAGRPGGFAEQRRAAMARSAPDRAYTQIILGFVTEAGHSRWLNHDEISAGAIAALSAAPPSEPRRQLIGTLTPWSARPR